MLTDSAITSVTSSYYDSISMEPNNHLHIVLGLHDTCAAPHTAVCVVETKDGGMTGRVIDVQNGATNWQEGGGAWVIDDQTFLYGADALSLTANGGATWTNVTPQGTYGFFGGEVETHPIARTSHGTYYLTSMEGIATSKDGLTWSLIPNFSSRVFGFVLSGGKLIASDEASPSLWLALESDPTSFQPITPPSGVPAGGGAPYVDYDPVHHVLYTSDFSYGAWRTTLE